MSCRVGTLAWTEPTASVKLSRFMTKKTEKNYSCEIKTSTLRQLMAEHCCYMKSCPLFGTDKHSAKL
jgi:hypothetical protein